jgi:hypothetical protein
MKQDEIMKSKRFDRIVFRIMTSVAAIGVVVVSIVVGANGTSERIAVRIDGVAISYSTVRVAEAIVRRTFEARFGRAPIEPADSEALQGMRTELEANRVRNHIRAHVRDSQVARFGITASTQEVVDRLEQMKRERDPEEVMTNQLEKNERIFAALQAIHEDGVDSFEAYGRFALEGHIAKEMWPTVVASYASESARIAFRGALDVPTSAKELEDHVRRVVIREKLEQRILEEVSEEDSDVAEYLKRRTENSSTEKAVMTDSSFLDSKRRNWWEARYREATVEIVDPRFEGILKSISE